MCDMYDKHKNPIVALEEDMDYGATAATRL